MEIQASAIYDYQTTKALVYISIHKKKNPTKHLVLWGVYLIIITTITVCFQRIFTSSLIVWVLLGALILFSLAYVAQHFYLPRRAYRAQDKFADIKILYTFRDEEMDVVADAEEKGYKGVSSIKYSMMHKIMETKAYLFIYQTKDNVYVVDKSTFEDGKMDTLREVLKKAMDEKYIVCKY